ncbi:uncharacterized protein LOC128244980 isoform X2 [Mya arenaria]|uniref:uncharacterized protein LOC128244980 isoform X2 n=1 Tax=Mya arenaria TaxID=6604 RepID=UPI0022E6E0D2|nr:uncharacterized protein LOC128244980 isoform X2 [Mya arenaria]
MDITYLLSVLFMVHTEIKPGISLVQLNTNGDITAVLGNNTFQLTCTNSGLTSAATRGFAMLLVKNERSLVVIPPLYTGKSIKINYRRIAVKRFMLDNPTTTVTFHSIECSDDGTYTWDGSYYAIESGQTSIATRQAIVVKVYPIFGPEDSQLTYSPTANLTEGDKVKFTCSGDVGNNPVDILAWFYYRNGEVAPTDESSDAVLTAPQVTRVCSRSRSSTIELTLTRDMDNTVVRCTVQQDIRTAEGEGHIDTNALSVTFIRSLIRYPDMQLYPERLEELQLRCYAEGNPLPGHFWLFNNSTRAGYGSLVLNNLTTAQEGTYTCVAYNYIKGVINNVSASTYIAIQNDTSNSFNRTIIDDFRESPTSNSKTSSKENDGSMSETKLDYIVWMIVGVVVGAFAVGAVGFSVMLVKRCYKRHKEQQQYKKTELIARFEGHTDFTGAHNNEHVNYAGNERSYQSLHGKHQHACQARATEEDYTGLDASSQVPEQQRNTNTDLNTSSEGSTAFTGIHNYENVNFTRE